MVIAYLETTLTLSGVDRILRETYSLFDLDTLKSEDGKISPTLWYVDSSENYVRMYKTPRDDPPGLISLPKLTIEYEGDQKGLELLKTKGLELKEKKFEILTKGLIVVARTR